MPDVLIDNTLLDTTDEGSPGASCVFTSTTVGYVFYIDGSSDVVYAKTTDGGATWGTAVALSPDKTWGTVGIWYDRWTPDDTTGNLIYVCAMETTTDDCWFNSINTGSSDAQSGWVAAILGNDYNPVPDGPCSICKGRNGVLYIAAVFGAANVPKFGLNMARSTDGGANWVGAGTVFDTLTTQYLDDDDSCCLVPLYTDNDVLLVMHDASATTMYWHRWDAVGLTWSAQQTLSTGIAYSATYGVQWSMAGNPATGDAYLAVLDDAAAGTGALRFYDYDESNGALGTWTRGADVMVSAAAPNTVLAPALTYDTTEDDIICYYAIGTASTTVNIYAKITTDNGASWAAQSPIFNDSNSVADDYKNIRCNWANASKFYVTWYDDDDNDLFGSPVTVYRVNGVTKDAALNPIGSVGIVAMQFPSTTEPYDGVTIVSNKLSKTDGTFVIASWTTDKIVVFGRDAGAPEAWGATEFLTPS